MRSAIPIAVLAVHLILMGIASSMSWIQTHVACPDMQNDNLPNSSGYLTIGVTPMKSVNGPGVPMMWTEALPGSITI